MPANPGRWHEIDPASPQWLQSGPVVVLEHVGWHALIAHEAPRAAVRTVPAPTDILVTVVHERPGTERQVSAARLSDDDRQRTYEDMAHYLEQAGVATPPRDLEWRIRLPDALGPDQFWQSLNEVAAPHLDDMSRPDVDRSAAWRALRRAVHDRLALLV